MKAAVAWFAENHVAANLLMVLIIIAGFASLPLIQQKSFPDIDVEVIQVGVTYLGAAPEEVEEGVCIRIEEAIQGIDGIEKLTSTATEGACGVSAELIAGYPVDRAVSEVKNAVDAITTFPVETEKPIVSHYQIRRNALQLALSGDASEQALKLLGERVRDEIATLPEVTQVELEASRRYEISIELPEESLQRHGLTFEEVVRAVRRGSLDRPGGSLKTEAGEVLLRAKGQAYTGADFEEIVVLTRDDGTRLQLRDVATVVDGFEEDEHYARFDGDPAVLVKVYRVGDQRVLDLVARVKEYVASAAASLPEGVELTVWRDGSRSLRDRLDILIRTGVSGFVLVFVVLALFLRLRLAFWVSLGIPISFLGALTLFPIFDVSIDVISLFAFIMVLGIVVDDAIVVGENVHRHQEQGDAPLDSAIRGAQEVAIPVTFGVLTTIAAFLPMILAPGHMGQIFGAIGTVVIFCLVFSWVESKLILPSHLGHMRLKPSGPGGDSPGERAAGLSQRWTRFQGKLADGLSRLVRERYRPTLARALEWRYATLAGGIAVLLVTLSVVSSGRMRFSFFPPVDGDFVTARLTMPQGVPVSLTEDAVLEIEASARRVKARLDEEFPDVEVVRHVLSTVGAQPGSGSRGSAASGAATHLGGVQIELIGGDDRPISSKKIEQLWREETPEIAGAEELLFKSALFSAGDPINIEFQARDVEELQRAAEALKLRLREYPGIFDVSDSFRDGKEEIRLTILESAQPLGLSLEDLADQVRQAFYGQEAQRIQRGRGYANIKRRDRQRVINVTADVNEKVANANEVMRDLDANFLPGLLADHPGVRYVVEGIQREQAEAMQGLIFNYGFALVLIYALLAIPLRSYGQPLIIMAVIPFGLVGAIGGHLLLGMNLSMMSVFGVVALSGVIVNDSLVLVHYVNDRRRQGVEQIDAVREAGEARFRPILLTSLTTFAGLTPLLLERSLSAQFLIPMATSLGFGVLFGTVVSLFLVPSSYVILEDVKSLLGMKPPQVPPRADVTSLRPVSGGAR
jgi:multidrug efflux pump subunit AcrB